MNLYAVENGSVSLLMTATHVIAEIPEVDGIDSVLAYAETETDALALADQYQNDETQPDNIRLWDGRTVAALACRDCFVEIPPPPALPLAAPGEMPEFSRTALYLLVLTQPFGTQIVVRRDGTLDTYDASLILSDQPDVVAVLKADGDFDRSSWGIERTDEGFVVRGLDGQVFDSDYEALMSAVAEFGLSAEEQEWIEDGVRAAMEKF